MFGAVAHGPLRHGPSHRRSQFWDYVFRSEKRMVRFPVRGNRGCSEVGIEMIVLSAAPSICFREYKCRVVSNVA